ncbi:MAG: hypothetical protein J0I06_05915 [Planctomycetes bacterium]|nr:hypothetical protein [Planctomycetota bacterium]
MKNRYFAVVLVAVVLAIRWAPTNRVRIVNGSGQTVHGVRADGCGRSTDLGDIPPGGSVACWFGTPRNEDVLNVWGHLGDGTPLQESSLYIVWEDYFRSDVVVIRADGTVSQR